MGNLGLKVPRNPRIDVIIVRELSLAFIQDWELVAAFMWNLHANRMSEILAPKSVN